MSTRSFDCPVKNCTGRFVTRTKLVEHRRTVHQADVSLTFKDKVTMTILRGNNGRFQCPVCYFDHDNANTFRMHGNRHQSTPTATVSVVQPSLGLPGSSLPAATATATPIVEEMLRFTPPLIEDLVAGEDTAFVQPDTTFVQGDTASVRGDTAIDDNDTAADESGGCTEEPKAAPLAPKDSPKADPAPGTDPTPGTGPTSLLASLLGTLDSLNKMTASELDASTTSALLQVPQPPRLPAQALPISSLKPSANPPPQLQPFTGLPSRSSPVTLPIPKLPKLPKPPKSPKPPKLPKISPSAPQITPQTASEHLRPNPLWLPSISTMWNHYGPPDLIQRMVALTMLDLESDDPAAGFTYLKQRMAANIKAAYQQASNLPLDIQRRVLTSIGILSVDAFNPEFSTRGQELLLRLLLFQLRTLELDFPFEDLVASKISSTPEEWKLRNAIMKILCKETIDDDTDGPELDYLVVSLLWQTPFAQVHSSEKFHHNLFLNFVALLAWDSWKKSDRRDFDAVAGDLVELETAIRALCVWTSFVLFDRNKAAGAYKPQNRFSTVFDLQDTKYYFEFLSADTPFAFGAFVRSIDYWRDWRKQDSKVSVSGVIRIDLQILDFGAVPQLLKETMSDLANLMAKLTFYQVLKLDLREIVDDVRNIEPGYGIDGGYPKDWLLEKFLAGANAVMSNGEINLQFIQAYSTYMSSALQLLATALLLTVGDVLGPQEVSHLTFRNGWLHRTCRNFFVIDGEMFVAFPNSGKVILRKLPVRLGLIVAKFIVFIIPFCDQMFKISKAQIVEVPFAWKMPLDPPTLFTTYTQRCYPPVSISNMFRSQALEVLKVDLKPDVIREVIRQLKRYLGVQIEPFYTTKIGNISQLTLPPDLVRTMKLEASSDETKWHAYLSGAPISDVLPASEPSTAMKVKIEAIASLQLAVTRTSDYVTIFTTRIAPLNKSDPKKHVVFTRTSALAKIMANNPLCPGFAITDLNEDRAVLAKWASASSRHFLFVPFGFKRAAFQELGVNITCVTYIGAPRSLADVLDHCPLPHALNVLAEPKREVTSVASEGDIEVQRWLDSGCYKVDLYHALGAPRRTCHQISGADCSFCRKNPARTQKDLGILTKLRSTKSCPFCYLHTGRLLKHDKTCENLEDVADLTTFIMECLYQARAAGVCACGLPKEKVCRTSCQLKMVPTVLACSIARDPGIWANLHPIKQFPPSPTVEWMLNPTDGGNGISTILDLALEAGFLPAVE
ncbi:hypothetical protein TWF730_008896 [Orbilia blumenaviensis]|uniref:C2H2-type domain-containing protein n=1 Tax=Orbilia blumenaviensis TaxID=1796055 RepID=A0AAV9UXF7_9PEZI